MVIKLPWLVFPASLFGTVVGVCVIIKDRSRGTKYESDVKVSGRTAIVTGANSGIGKATATELAKKGGRVILACRDLKSAFKARDEIIEETYNVNVDVKYLDLASLESIAEFAKDINSSEKRLDILVNNAGLYDLSKKRRITQDGFEIHLGINYLGPFLLTNLLLPKLVESKPSRVVNIITISMNKATINFDDFNSAKSYDASSAYVSSKLALMSFSHKLNDKVDGVTSYAVYPGLAITRLARGKANSKVSSVFFKPTNIFLRSAEDAAQTILYCCCEPDIKYTSNTFLRDLKSEKWSSELSAEDSIRLWRIAEMWTRLGSYKQSLVNSTDKNKTAKTS